MENKVKLEKFEGPLELLLQLIEQEELNISEISLSKVTEQFFGYLNGLEHNRSEELADFLVIATRLVYLKSKNLLPYLYPEADEGPSLADQLKLYKRYADASKLIEEIWQSGRLSYGRVEPPIRATGFVLPANAQAEDLKTSFLNLLRRLKPANPLPQVSIDRAISVKQKVENILQAIKNVKNLSFREMTSGAENRTDVIVSFLAVLELLKSEQISIHQSGVFEDMMIKKT